MKSSRPKIVDLFSGAGGLSLGAARAGFDVCGAVDTDPHALTAHRLNFSSSRHLDADVAAITGESLLGLLELQSNEVCGIVGGPPCQGFSNMGRRDRNDFRNGLFVDFFRIVAEVKPAFYLAENVPGILHQSNNPLVEEALSKVNDLYTNSFSMKISANNYGAPTTRTRVFFFGFDPVRVERLNENSFAPPTDAETVLVKDALNGLPEIVDSSWQQESDGWRVSESNGGGAFASRLRAHVPDDIGDPIALHRLRSEHKSSGNLGTAHTPQVERRYAALKPGERDLVSKSQRLHPDGFCPTLRAGTGSDRGSYQAVRPIHPSVPRVITPREAARLQGFPDWFTFAPTKWHSFRQIGSSVSPILAEQLMSVIHKSVIA